MRMRVSCGSIPQDLFTNMCYLASGVEKIAVNPRVSMHYQYMGWNKSKVLLRRLVFESRCKNAKCFVFWSWIQSERPIQYIGFSYQLSESFVCFFFPDFFRHWTFSIECLIIMFRIISYRFNAVLWFVDAAWETDPHSPIFG